MSLHTMTYLLTTQELLDDHPDLNLRQQLRALHLRVAVFHAMALTQEDQWRYELTGARYAAPPFDPAPLRIKRWWRNG